MHDENDSDMIEPSCRCSRMCTSETFVRSRQTASIFGQIAIKLQYRRRLSKTLLGNWSADSGSAKNDIGRPRKNVMRLSRLLRSFQTQNLSQKELLLQHVCRRGAHFFFLSRVIFMERIDF